MSESFENFWHTRVTTTYSSSDLASVIDHTLLKPEAGVAAIRRCCDEARAHGFASVCVNSRFVPQVVAALAESDVVACAVVGFPLGAMASQAKAVEAEIAVAAGAAEIDMVLPIGALIDGDYDTVARDIAAVRERCRSAKLKVIIEACLLNDAQKIAACEIAAEAGADFVKTSTGFAGGGATLADVALMRRTVGDQLGVKASGGIRSRADALAMLEAGATRLGASASVAIVGEDSA